MTNNFLEFPKLKWQHLTPHTNTHPFNGLFSGTIRVSRYQKGKTNLDFTEARDSEWKWHQLGHTICKSAPRSRQITMPALTTQFLPRDAMHPQY